MTSHRRYMGLFELHYGYQRARSALWRPYLSKGAEAWYRRLRKPQFRVRWRARNASRLLVTAVSNCVDYAGRREYLTALRNVLGDRFINLGNCVPSGGAHRPQARRYEPTIRC